MVEGNFIILHKTYIQLHACIPSLYDQHILLKRIYVPRPTVKSLSYVLVSPCINAVNTE